MTLIVSGEYGNVRRFIHQLETAPEFLVLESVSVMRPRGSRAQRHRACVDVLPGSHGN